MRTQNSCCLLVFDVFEVEACSTRTILSLCYAAWRKIEEFDFDGSSSFLVIVLAKSLRVLAKEEEKSTKFIFDRFVLLYLPELDGCFSVLLFFFTCIDRDRT